MRHSSSFFWESVLICTASVLILNGCGANTPVKNGPDPYDSYYGQPNSSSSDAAPVFQYSDIVVNPSAPRTYTVRKGDTLWGIARKFLNTPWYWPEVWDKNQGIKNPHLIYPGDVLTLDYVGGATGGGKLSPRIRIDRGGREGQPISSLIPFMVWPRVLDESTIDNAPYIIASQDDHSLITEGEKIYVRGLGNVVEGSRCAIFHKNKPLYDTETNALLGYEVTYSGYSRVERVGEPSTATVMELKREVRKGDRLLAPVDETRNLNEPIQAPTFKVRGEVIALFDAEAISGNYMIATINKGYRDSIRVGHTLGVYGKGKKVDDPYLNRKHRSGADLPVSVELPPEKVANMVIYKVTNNVSYGLIMDATREVEKGDKIGNP